MNKARHTCYNKTRDMCRGDYQSPVKTLIKWSGAEVVITVLTRNQLVAHAARGFESHPLRQKRTDTMRYLSLFMLERWDSNVGAIIDRPRGAPRTGATRRRREKCPVDTFATRPGGESHPQKSLILY